MRVIARPIASRSGPQSGREGTLTGTPSLRKAVAEHLSHSRRAPYAAEEVTICHSAKHALSGAIFALIEEGDEVLVPLPAWASYFDLVRCAGGTPVLVDPDERDIAPFRERRCGRGRFAETELAVDLVRDDQKVVTRRHVEKLLRRLV